jgi:uracil-DNA glycosylase family 4
MSRAARVDVVAAVQDYIRYLQYLGVTELPVPLAPPARRAPATVQEGAVAAAAPAPSLPTDAAPAVRLAQLAAAVRDCRNCRLHAGRTQVVFGTGDPAAALAFVGEAPGHEEDVQGEPFVGPAGQLLTRIIAAIGLTREQVYLLNVIKCRPPHNRNPQPDEVAACRPILQEQLACLRPRVICALGAFAAQTLLHTEEKISRLRGRWHRLGDIQVMPTYHPAFLLRYPQYKRAVWEDMQLVQGALGLL